MPLFLLSLGLMLYLLEKGNQSWFLRQDHIAGGGELYFETATTDGILRFAPSILTSSRPRIFYSVLCALRTSKEYTPKLSSGSPSDPIVPRSRVNVAESNQEKED